MESSSRFKIGQSHRWRAAGSARNRFRKEFLIAGKIKFFPRRRVAATADNLHFRIIRFPVSHYEKARVSLRLLKERNGGKTSEITPRRAVGGERAVVSAVRLSLSSWLCRAISLWYYEEKRS
jgi:hypothetical protein